MNKLHFGKNHYFTLGSIGARVAWMTQRDRLLLPLAERRCLSVDWGCHAVPPVG
jgi:hypothetical protein